MNIESLINFGISNPLENLTYEELLSTAVVLGAFAFGVTSYAGICFAKDLYERYRINQRHQEQKNELHNNL